MSSELPPPIKEVDLIFAQNHESHHTDKFAAARKGEHIVRRGQKFRLKISLEGEYKGGPPNVTLFFFYIGSRFFQELKRKPADNPMIPTVTVKVKPESFTERDDQPTTDWQAFLKYPDPGKLHDTLLVQVTPASKTAIGEWKLHIHYDPNAAAAYKMDKNIYVLFNPWNKDDTVNLSSLADKNGGDVEALLKEYVTAHDGIIFKTEACSGTLITGLPWVFGQHGKDILDAVLFILLRKRKDPNNAEADQDGWVHPAPADLEDPSKVARAIATGLGGWLKKAERAGEVDMCEGGVLEKEPLVVDYDNYQGGVSPFTWIGSGTILRTYFKNNQAPPATNDMEQPGTAATKNMKAVKYGQCWVFAGVANTICRAIGLPARVVTNFNSADDVNENLMVEEFVKRDEKGYKQDESRPVETIRPFAVWNEVWIDGEWHAIDSSDGRGPKIVKELKEGNFNAGYDGFHFFGKINADNVMWDTTDENNWKILDWNTSKVGRDISTKAVGSIQHVDITNEYKHTEFTAEERKTYLKAISELFEQRDKSVPVEKYDIYRRNEEILRNVEFNFVGDPTKFGDEIVAIINVTTETNEEFTLVGSLSIESVKYNGRSKVLDSEPVKEEVRKNVTTVLSIEFNAYHKKFRSKSFSYLNLVLNVAVRTQSLSAHRKISTPIQFKMPDFTIECDEVLDIWERLPVTFKLSNKLKHNLKKCSITVCGEGLVKETTFILPSVKSGETGELEVYLQPRTLGVITIVAHFSCRYFQPLSQTKEIKVKK